jgi:hypothetical protein
MPHGFTSDLKMKFYAPVPAKPAATAPTSASTSAPAITDPQAATTDDESAGDLLIEMLPDEQRRAIQLLVEPRAGDNLDPGATSRRPRPTYTRIAQQVGVDRSTLYRWLTHDRAFNRALTQWQDLLAKRHRSRVLLLGDSRPPSALYTASRTLAPARSKPPGFTSAVVPAKTARKLGPANRPRCSKG